DITESEATKVAARIGEAVTRPLVVDSRELFVTVSIGIALGQTAANPAALLRDADAAMYRAKERGRAGWALFDSAMWTRGVQRLDLENALHQAQRRDELRIFYQPTIAIGTRALVGGAALLRWAAPGKRIR